MNEKRAPRAAWVKQACSAFDSTTAFAKQRFGWFTTKDESGWGEGEKGGGGKKEEWDLCKHLPVDTEHTVRVGTKRGGKKRGLSLAVSF